MTERQRIERAIFNAQVASDGGKGIYELCKEDLQAQEIAHCKEFLGHIVPSDKSSYRASYQAKESQILLAIQLICRSHDRSIRFSVTESHTPEYGSKYDPDVDWWVQDRSKIIGYFDCFIVYFDFKINGKREQISFHSFDERLRKYVSKSKKTTWSKDRTSRKTAKDLKRYGTSQR